MIKTANNRLNNRQLLLLSDICLILVAMLWGSSYGAAKLSLQYYPVIGFLAIRFGLTSIILAPVLIGVYKQHTIQLKRTVAAGLPLGTILLAIFIFETYGLFHTSVTNAAFLISLCIIMTPFMEWLILKTRPHKLVFICSILSLLGTYFLTMDAQHSAGISLNLGDSLILLAAVGRALMVTMTKKLIDNKSAIIKMTIEIAQPISPLALTAVQSIVVFVGCFVLFLVTNLLSGDSIMLSLPNESAFWLPTFYLIIFCTIFAFFVQNWAIKIGSPSRASLLMGSEPIFGVLFAVLLFNEHVGVLSWLGGGLITLASVLLVSRGR